MFNVVVFSLCVYMYSIAFFVQAEDGIRDLVRSRGLGDVYKRQRTLRMSEWQVVWEVIILGKIDLVFEIIRQNFAIALSLIHI